MTSDSCACNAHSDDNGGEGTGQSNIERKSCTDAIAPYSSTYNRPAAATEHNITDRHDNVGNVAN